MKMTTAVRLLQLLPVRPEDAITIEQLVSRWRNGKDTDKENDTRNIQRYMNDLTIDGMDGPALVEMIEERPRRFYLKLSRVAQWFMTEEASLNILLTRQVLGRSFGSVGRLDARKQVEIAEKVASASAETKRIRERVRVVPDGLGRQPARVDPKVLQSTIDAVAKSKRLSFSYANQQGKPSTQLVSPQGLVAKDGTLYLLGTKGLADKPRHFALHRMSAAEVDHRPLQVQSDFDLDRYIQDSNMLSHTLDGQKSPVELKLRVAPDTLFHFKERRLSSDQTIGPASRRGGWYAVTATVPYTVLLVPFLLSMGGGIEVLGPSEVRDETVKRLRAAATHYASKSPR